MTDSALIERITRSLAFMLRHQPETFDLELDAHGFADLEDVVQALNERLGEPVEEEDVRDAVGSGDRPRYEIREDRIRALYGHSIPVEPGPSSKPPEYLYVSVPARELERARRFGLRGGRRRFLHLAISAEDAAESGRRASRDYTVLMIHALDAWEEGISFYDRTALWLAEEVPTHLIEVEGNYHDGSEPMLRSHSDGDRQGGGREQRDRRGGRSRRRRGRGRDRGFDRDPERDDRDQDRDRYEPAAAREEAPHGERAPMATGAERAGGDEFERELEPVRDVQAHRPSPGEHARRGDERGGQGGREGRAHGERGARGGRSDDRREWDSRRGGGRERGRDRGEGRREGRGERRPERRDEGHAGHVGREGREGRPEGREGREGRPEGRSEGRPSQERGASSGPRSSGPRSGFGAGLQDAESRAARPVREPRPAPPPPPPPPPREERPAPVDRPEFGAGL